MLLSSPFFLLLRLLLLRLLRFPLALALDGSLNSSFCSNEEEEEDDDDSSPHLAMVLDAFLLDAVLLVE